MKPTELKPCPFCGQDTASLLGDGEGGGSIWCPSCSGGTGHYMAMKEAVAAWNRRAELSKPDKLAIADEVYGWWMRYMENPMVRQASLAELVE